MRVEAICTGDELLTGLTADTNSPFFGRLLLEQCALQIERTVVVPDQRVEIIEALNAAVSRCDLVLVSGGLGPTADDLTAECAAEAAGVPLVEDPTVLAHLTERCRLRNLAITPNNRRQARVPQLAEVVLNTEGAAPLFIQRRGQCTLFFVPGVPREYRHLVQTQVLPRIVALASRAGPRVFQSLKVLKTVGLPESQLDAMVRPLASKHPSVTFGFRTHAPENHLKLMARAPTLEQAQAAMVAAERDSRDLLGEYVFGADDDSMASVVLQRLRTAHHTVAVAESCTGGLVSSLFTSVPGASDVFLGGAVTYAEGLKTQWAHVSPELLGQHGAVCEPVARAMAAGIRDATGATWGLAVTGYAGPGGGDAQHPVGTVFLAVSTQGREHSEHHTFGGDRDRVRSFAASTLIDLLRRTC